MAVKNGNLCLLRYKSASTTYTLSGVVSNSVEISHDPIDVTTKDHVGVATYIAGRKGGTMTVSGLYDPAATTGTGALDVFALLTAGTEVEAYWGETTAATKYFKALAFITSISVDAEKDGVTQWSANLQLSGAITVETNATT